MTAVKNPSEKVIAAIRAGHHDGHLSDIIEAVAQHMRDTTIRMCWRFRLHGDVWDQDTVTTGELAVAEKLLSTERRPFSYAQLDPLRFLDHRIALMIAHLHKADGLDISDARAYVEGIPLPEQENVVEMYEAGVDQPVG
jgi:hypothetical protein